MENCYIGEDISLYCKKDDLMDYVDWNVNIMVENACKSSIVSTMTKQNPALLQGKVDFNIYLYIEKLRFFKTT